MTGISSDANSVVCQHNASEVQRKYPSPLRLGRLMTSIFQRDNVGAGVFPIVVRIAKCIVSAESLISNPRLRWSRQLNVVRRRFAACPESVIL